jgi:hypothetical protein
MKSAKQRLIDAGYEWHKPENNMPGSARRVVSYCGRLFWVVNSCDEANELANELLGAE